MNRKSKSGWGPSIKKEDVIVKNFDVDETVTRTASGPLPFHGQFERRKTMC